GNHCFDELMAFRRGFIDTIPAGVVNDGAYFGVLAARRGMTVQFVPGAKVLVAIPGNLLGLIRQRRRILRGHRQVLDLLGAPVFTLEGLAKRQPALVAKILIAEFASRPGPTLAFLPPVPGLSFAFLNQRLGGVGYLPLWPLIVAGLYRVYAALPGGSRFVLYFLLKQPPILADVLLGYCIQRSIVRWSGNETTAL